VCFHHSDFDAHEHVAFAHDDASGLTAIIAIHDTRLGPALGGTRFWRYADTDAAISDALRLSRGMTYKNAVVGLNWGGGKAVIIGDPARDKSPALWRAYAEALNRLGGLFLTGEDVGMTVADVDAVRRHCPYIVGSSSGAAASGDPSPFTAEGVFLGLGATAKAARGVADLTGIRVGVLGLGSVGWKLAEKLHGAGAKLIVADLDADKAKRAADAFGAETAAPDTLIRCEMDVFSPCALGGTLDESAVEGLKAFAIAGAANNQLATPDMDLALAQRGILYAPDYVVNAGGVQRRRRGGRRLRRRQRDGPRAPDSRNADRDLQPRQGDRTADQREVADAVAGSVCRRRHRPPRRKAFNRLRTDRPWTIRPTPPPAWGVR